MAQASAVSLQTPTELLALPAEGVRERVFGSSAPTQAVIASLARRQVESLTRMESLVFGERGEGLAAYLLEDAPGPHAPF